MSKAHSPKDFVDAPRPEYRSFEDLMNDDKPPSKKKLRKWEKTAAKRERKAAKRENKLRKEDVGKKYEIRFNRYDTESFYENRLVLPAAAHWNLDEFLMVFLAEGVQALLDGPTDWNWSLTEGKKPSTRKKLKKVVKLCRAHVKASRDMEDPEGKGDRALRIIADIGVSQLWD